MVVVVMVEMRSGLVVKVSVVVVVAEASFLCGFAARRNLSSLRYKIRKRVFRYL